MWVFINGISNTATKKDLSNLLAWGVRYRWLHLPLPAIYSLKQCEILQITNLASSNKITKRYGLALIEPDKSARMAIDYLNNTRIKNTKFEAHQFVRRSPYRDRRQRFCNLNELGDRERRKRDRRRSDLRSRVLDEPRVEQILGIKRLNI